MLSGARATVEDAPTLKTDAQATWDGSVFRIEDTKTRVSLASIKLSVSDLKPEDGNLVGEYTIHVPLMSSKNDQGKIILPLNQSVTELGAKGGVLRGRAISYKKAPRPTQSFAKSFPARIRRSYSKSPPTTEPWSSNPATRSL